MPEPTRDFVYQALPMRVSFGAGRYAEVSAELDHLGLTRVLVLCTAGQVGTARIVADALRGRCAGMFAGAVMHVPVEVADRACDLAAELGADGCVAVGGGSTVGLGKAIALRHGLPVVAVPTTYAGSEMTPVWGLTEAGVKRTGRDPVVLPRSVVYDPGLTVSLPVDLSITSGLNALAHAAEGLYAPDGSPIVALMAQEGARSIISALPRIAAAPTDPTARADALRGAWLCGAVLGATSMSLHHQLCHILGGTFGLPHAKVHTVVLPHALAFTLPAAPAAAGALGGALGVAPADVPNALHALAAGLGAPTDLASLGMPADGAPEVVRQVLTRPYPGPRPVTADAVRALLDRAVSGAPPK
jgi:maleylacetate reductase